MTLSSYFCFLNRSKGTTNNIKTMNATALMVFVLLFLTSILAHADHLTDNNTTIEQQNCQLCNQGIDTPPEESIVQAIVISRYNSFIPEVIINDFLPSQFVQPLLRAPPFSQ
jgi:hypothetical protein